MVPGSPSSGKGGPEYLVAVGSRPVLDPEGVARLVGEVVEAAGGLGRLIGPEDRVLVKPNLVVASPSTSGATTDPAVVGAVLDLVAQARPRSVVVAESSALGVDTARAFEVSGIGAVCEARGVPWIDLKGRPASEVPVPAGRALERVKVFQAALDCSVLIDLPVLKAHCQTTVTLGTKNIKGLIPDSEKRRCHTLHLDQAVADLATVIRPDFTVVDGICGDLVFEEGGTPVRMNTILAGRNTLAVDVVAASRLGYAAREVEHLALAAEHGLGPASLEEVPRVELEGCGPSTWEEAQANRREGGLVSSFPVEIEQAGACSPCLGALVFALQKLGPAAGRLGGGIRIGQGLAREAGPSDISIGRCAGQGGRAWLAGCPPTALEIHRLLSGLLDR